MQNRKGKKKKKGKGELLTSEPSYCSLKNCLTIKEVYVSIFYSKKGNKNVLFCNSKLLLLNYREIIHLLLCIYILMY